MFGYIVNGEYYKINNVFSYCGLSFSIIFVIALYLLRSFGLYALATKSKDSKVNSIAVLSFIPCAWVYVAGKLAGRVNFFGNEIKSFALLATIIFSIAKIATLTCDVLSYYPVIRCIFNGETIYFSLEGNETTSYFVLSTMSGNLSNSFGATTQVVIDSLTYVVRLIGLLSEVMLLFVWIALFKKYWPAHYTLGTLLSLIGAFPIIIFCLRKKQPVDYEAFLRERFQRIYGQNYNQNGFNNNYNNYNNFNNNNYSNDRIDPFESFNSSSSSSSSNNDSSSDDDPFADFDKKN